MLKEFEHAIGCAGREHRAADHKATDVVKVEAVDVLVRRYGMQDARQVEGRRQRQLNQNAMPAGSSFNSAILATTASCLTSIG
jgi:hypothetical protein